MLVVLYGAGYPALILHQIRARRRRFEWVPDPRHPGHGRYEAKPGEVKPPADTTYNFLELEQQVGGGGGGGRTPARAQDGRKAEGREDETGFGVLSGRVVMLVGSLVV